MLYRLILQMDPVAQLQFYKTAAEADAWTTLQITIDANAPALALALVAQRAAMTAISVLNTTTQPSAPLVWPVMIWLITTLRKLLEFAIQAGACSGSPSLLDTPPTQSEPQFTSLARFLVGLQQAMYVRYPFEVLGGTVELQSVKLRLRGVLSASTNPDFVGQPLCGGKLRFENGPGMNDQFILAALVHPHVSPILQYYDGPFLLGRACVAASDIFSALYTPQQACVTSASNDLDDWDPLGPADVLADVPGMDWSALLRAGVKALRAPASKLVTEHGADRFSVEPFEWMMTEGLTVSFPILPASQLATYSIQATAADSERAHSEAGEHWTDNRRGLSTRAGSDETVVAQHLKREKVRLDAVPVLADIECLPQILHELQCILMTQITTAGAAGVGTFSKVFPDLKSPPPRKLTKAETRMATELGSLSSRLPGLKDIVRTVRFSDTEIVDADADAAEDALVTGAIVPEAGGHLISRDLLPSDDEESDKSASDASGAETASNAGDIAGAGGGQLGRRGNSSLRIAMRRIRALAAEQESDVTAAIASEEAAAAMKKSQEAAAKAAKALVGNVEEPQPVLAKRRRSKGKKAKPTPARAAKLTSAVNTGSEHTPSVGVSGTRLNAAGPATGGVQAQRTMAVLVAEGEEEEEEEEEEEGEEGGGGRAGLN